MASNTASKDKDVDVGAYKNMRKKETLQIKNEKVEEASYCTCALGKPCKSVGGCEGVV
jgi:hypothetical protein